MVCLMWTRGSLGPFVSFHRCNVLLSSFFSWRNCPSVRLPRR